MDYGSSDFRELCGLLVVMRLLFARLLHQLLDLFATPSGRSATGIVVLESESVKHIGAPQVGPHPVQYGALHAVLRHASYRTAARLP
jgi:hypothetical protein